MRTFFFLWICTGFGKLRWRPGSWVLTAGRTDSLCYAKGRILPLDFPGSEEEMGAGCPLASCRSKNKKCCGARQFPSGPVVAPWKKRDSSDLFCRCQWELRARWAVRWQHWGWIRRAGNASSCVPIAGACCCPGALSSSCWHQREWLPLTVKGLGSHL